MTLQGLFTLLVEEFGCRGVEVEEVYDLDSFDMHSGEVYGLIFLFKWASDQPGNNRTSSRRTREKDKNIEKNTEIVNYHEGMNFEIRCFGSNWVHEGLQIGCHETHKRYHKHNL